MSDKIAYNKAEAAALVGLSEDTIGKALRGGTLRAKRTGKRRQDGKVTGSYLISRDALLAWFEELEDA